MAEIWGYQGRNRRYNLAAQDQVITTNYFNRKIMKEYITNKC
jgi:hypothetical protein